jgi:5-(carboxyamino)imidazole ribonucleotide mutase
LLAVQILASHQPELLQQVLEYRHSLKQSVLEKQHRLEQLGYSQYLREQIAQGSG